MCEFYKCVHRDYTKYICDIYKKVIRDTNG